MRGTLLAYVAHCNVKVTHIFPGAGAYLNIDEKMIAKAPIIDSRLNLKMTQKPWI